MNLAHALGLLYSLLALGVLLFARFLIPVKEFFDSLPPCAFKTILHLPCPTCGVTRSIMALSRFEFLTALRMNPLVVLTVIILLIWGCLAIVGIIRHRSIEFAMTPIRLNLIRIAFTSVILFHWLFLILDHR